METVFDTLAYTRRLKDAGIAEEYVEVHAEALRAAPGGGVATRADIVRLETGLDTDMRAMRWVLGLVVALLAAMAARPFGAI